MRQRSFVPERHEFVAQFQPAAQMRRRVGRAAGPLHAGQRAADVEVSRVLPEFQESDARTFRKRELEIAALGKADQDFTDQRRSFSFIQELAGPRLPVRRRADEIVNRATARKNDSDYDEHRRPKERAPHETASSASRSEGAGSFCGTSVRRGQSGIYFWSLTSM